MACSKCRAVPQWHMAEKCRILEKGQISRVAKYTYNGTCRKGPKGILYRNKPAVLSYSNLQWQKSAESPLQKHAPLTQESAGLALAFEYYTERSAK